MLYYKYKINTCKYIKYYKSAVCHWKKNISVKDVGKLTVFGVCRVRGNEKSLFPHCFASVSC